MTTAASITPPDSVSAHEENSPMTAPTAPAQPLEATAAAPVLVDCPADALPCSTCGAATAAQRASSAQTVTVSTPTLRQGAPASTWTVEMTTCYDCAVLSVRSVRLARAHPGVGSRLGLGQQTLVREAILSALVALQLLGQPLPDPGTQERELVRLIRTLAPVGGAARWRRIINASTRDKVAARPWAAVSPDTRAGLRAAHAAMLAEHVALTAEDVLLPPPAIPAAELRSSSVVVPVPDGCLLCGVAALQSSAVEVQRAGGPATAAREVWHRHFRVSPGSLGARRGPHYVTGWTCPACAQAVDRTGAIGLSAAERALVVHLGLGSRWTGDQELTGLRTFGALVSDTRRPDARPSIATTAPNGTPWAHLGSAEELRARLGSDLGVTV